MSTWNLWIELKAELISKVPQRETKDPKAGKRFNGPELVQLLMETGKANTVEEAEALGEDMRQKGYFYFSGTGMHGFRNKAKYRYRWPDEEKEKKDKKEKVARSPAGSPGRSKEGRTVMQRVMLKQRMMGGMFPKRPLDSAADHKVLVSEEEDLAVAKLKVTILSGQGLAAKDHYSASESSSDPFCRVWLVDQYENTLPGMEKSKKTNVVKHSLDPVWGKQNEGFELIFGLSAEHARAAAFVYVQVWDHDYGSPHDFMGSALVPIKSGTSEHLLEEEADKPEWVSGTIRVAVELGSAGTDIIKDAVPEGRIGAEPAVPEGVWARARQKETEEAEEAAAQERIGAEQIELDERLLDTCTRLMRGTCTGAHVDALCDEHTELLLPVLVRLPHMRPHLARRIGDSAWFLSRLFWLHQGVPVHPSFAPLLALCGVLDVNAVHFFGKAVHDCEAWAKDKELTGPTFNNPMDARHRPVNKVMISKVFASGHAPAVVKLYHHDDHDTDTPTKIVLKPDECTWDQMVQHMFRVFNAIWRTSSMRHTPEAITFEVLAAGPKFGLMEFVQPSQPLREWNKNAILTFSGHELNEFMRTAVGGYVAGYVLGVRDRHSDNFMIKNNYQFFQLDFKHCFNRKTKVLDAPRFAIPKEMKCALVTRGAWGRFKRMCARAHQELRRFYPLVWFISRHLFQGLFSPQEIEHCLVDSFKMGLSELEACAHIGVSIEHGVTSFQKYMKETVHSINLRRNN